MASAMGHVHLIGSVPLGSTEQVFRQVCGALGPYLERVPDGETGERAGWVRFQQAMLARHPQMEVDPTVEPLHWRQWDGKLLREVPQLRFKDGVDPATIDFATGYDVAAIQSYEVFKRLRAEGTIPAAVRFQVCLPTPMASGCMYVSWKARDAYLAAYETSLLHALRTIAAAIPAADLSIQYDVCQEVLVFENYFPHRWPDYKERIFAMEGRLGEAVPTGVELGYHLCYGSPADEHIVQPKDAAVLVDLMNGIGDAVKRPLDFLHVPVPKPRTDDAYVAPFKDWRARPETKLYLGLLHHDDDAGNERRIAAARRHVADFGVASECGWGRTEPGRLPGLLAAHRQWAAA
jgi:hypothetical protein